MFGGLGGTPIPPNIFFMKNYRDLDYVQLETQRYRAELTRRKSALETELLNIKILIKDLDGENNDTRDSTL